MRWPMVVIAVLALGCMALPTRAAEEPGEAQKAVEEAKANAGNVAAQALALARLAWPEGPGGVPHPETSALAREELVRFGQNAIRALREALRRVDRSYSADVTMALIEARKRVRAGIPVDFIPAMDLALWFGSAEAQRLAIHQLAQVRFRAALLPMADAAYEHRDLVPEVVRGMVLMRDDRARFFLHDIMLEGSPDERPLAASALGQIGGRCLDLLRDAVLSEDRELRPIALNAILPISTLDDLGVLYEYLARYEDDDPDMIAAVRQRAALLESVLERSEDVEAASPSLDN